MSKKRKAAGGGPAQPAAGRKGKKGKPALLQDVPLPDASEDADDAAALSDDDLAFVSSHADRLGFLSGLDAAALNASVHSSQRAGVEAARRAREEAAAVAARGVAADGSDDEEDDGAAGATKGRAAAATTTTAEAEYERRPRTLGDADAAGRTSGAALLPVKTLDGAVVFEPPAAARAVRASRVASKVAGVTVEDALDEADRAAADARREAALQAEAEREAARAARAAADATAKAAAARDALPPALVALAAERDPARRRAAARQHMAAAAQHLLASPERAAAGAPMRTLLALCGDGDAVVRRLALLSCLAVFRDVLPGYRIRPPSEAELAVKASKEVAALRAHEAALLRAYQTFLKALLAALDAGGAPAAGGAAKKKGSGDAGAGSRASAAAALATARIAVRCMAGMLAARPGFNYTTDLLQALVPRLTARDADVRGEAAAAVRRLLAGADAGGASGGAALEALQLAADLVRRVKCGAPPDALRCLLGLRLSAVTPTAAAADGGKAAPPPPRKKRKKKKDALERDLSEAATGPDAAEVAAQQSRMVEALFEVLFRVLKHAANGCCASIAAAASASAENFEGQQREQQPTTATATAVVPPWPAARVAARFPLLQPALEGLARYAHLLSVEYFEDVMAVLQRLLASGALPLRERLLVLLAAADILRGQGEALLKVDRRGFYNALYAALLLAPLAPLHEEGEGVGRGGGGGGGGGGSGGSAGGGSNGDNEEEEEDARAIAGAAAARGDDAATRGLDGGAAAYATGGARAPTGVLLVRCLDTMLLRSKQTDAARLAAFAKRIAALVLASPPGEAMGLASLLARLLRRYPRLLCLLEWEGGAPVGGRSFDAAATDPSDAGALAAALWELTLASRHAHPHVAAAAAAVLALTPGGAAAKRAASGGGDGSGAIGGVLGGIHGPEDLAALYSVADRGGFRPAPPKPHPPRVRGASAMRAAAVAAARRGLCDELVVALDGVDVDGADDAQLSLGDALARHYRVARRFARNDRLRQERLLLEARLALFERHLINRRRREAEAAAAADARQPKEPKHNQQKQKPAKQQAGKRGRAA